MKIYLTLIVLFAAVFSATAQRKDYKGKMNVTPLQLEQKGDSLYIRIAFDISGVNVDSRRSISLIPSLTTAGIEQKLPEVMVKGRADYLCAKRREALMSKTERQLYNKNRPYAIVKGYKKNEAKQILYQKTIPFEAWMKDARLDIREDLSGCGNAPRILSVSQLVNAIQLEQKIIIQPYVVMPYLAYIQPQVEEIKRREITGEAFLDFVVNKTDIRPDYLNNPNELKKITDMMALVRDDSAIVVRGINVIGYASPEGAYANNQLLSEGRAKALVDYLAPRFSYPQNMYHVVFGGENWDGLLAMVEKTEMPYRNEVIRILTTVPAEINYKTNSSRKKSLMTLRAGDPYRYMLKEFYPYLRKAICKINYEVKGFDVVEAKRVFTTRPQNLSLNEMYLVANTYESGSKEFADVFETAVRMFPEDEVANLNAAVASLARKDIVAAEGYLMKVTSRSAEYFNAAGVLAMLKGDYATAGEHLDQAKQKGLPEATKNLEELDKKLKNNDSIKNQNN